MAHTPASVGWPFVGRAHLLADLRDALQRGGAIVEGPAGVGKTALADAAAPQPTVRIMASTPGPTPDLPALVEASSHTQGRDRAAIPIVRVDDVDDLEPDLAGQLVRLAAEGHIHVAVSGRPR